MRHLGTKTIYDIRQRGRTHSAAVWVCPADGVYSPRVGQPSQARTAIALRDHSLVCLSATLRRVGSAATAPHRTALLRGCRWPWSCSVSLVRVALDISLSVSYYLSRSLFLSLSCYFLDRLAKDDAIGWFVIFNKK